MIVPIAPKKQTSDLAGFGANTPCQEDVSAICALGLLFRTKGNSGPEWRCRGARVRAVAAANERPPEE